MTGRAALTGAAVVLALAVIGAAAFALVRWWEGPQDGGELALVPVPLDRFDPPPSSFSRIVDLPQGPALLGSSDCVARRPNAACGPVMWVEDGPRWAGHALAVPDRLHAVQVTGVAAGDDRVLMVGRGFNEDHDGAQLLLWRGVDVETLRLERLPASLGEVNCDRSSPPGPGRWCRDVVVRAAAETSGGSLLVTQQGSGRGTIGVYRRDDSGWRQLPTPALLTLVDDSISVGGTLVLAGRFCQTCPAHLDVDPGLVTTDDGTSWEPRGSGVVPPAPTAGVAGSRDGAVAALMVDEQRCRLAHSRDGRGWRLLTGTRACDGQLLLATAGDLIAVADVGGDVVDVRRVDGRHVGTVPLPPGSRLRDLGGAGSRIIVTAGSEDPGPMLFEVALRDAR